MKITVIGCGRWGTFLAWYLSGIGHEVTLYGREGSDRYSQLLSSRTNGLVELDGKVSLSCSLPEAVREAQVLIVSIGAQGLRSLARELTACEVDGKPLALCMKGIEERTGCRLTQIIEEALPGRVRIAVWVGPGHVQDFTRGEPNCMVIDSADDRTKAELIEAFSSPLIRFYYGTDLIGNEIGAASKNVIGIAAGLLDGLGRSSLKGALMSRGTREIARLIRAMGGNEMTAYGLSHLGDYEATLFSRHSHNRMFGEMFALNRTYGDSAEGVSTVKGILLLGERHGVELPICQAVNAVIHEGQAPSRCLSDLFLRSLKEEF